MLGKDFFKLDGEFEAVKTPSGWELHCGSNKLGSVRHDVRTFGTLHGIVAECIKHGASEFTVICNEPENP